MLCNGIEEYFPSSFVIKNIQQKAQRNLIAYVVNMENLNHLNKIFLQNFLPIII